MTAEDRAREAYDKWLAEPVEGVDGSRGYDADPLYLDADRASWIGFRAGFLALIVRVERLEGALEETTLSLTVIAEMPLAEQDDMHAMNMRAVAKRGLTHVRRARAALEQPDAR